MDTEPKPEEQAKFSGADTAQNLIDSVPQLDTSTEMATPPQFEASESAEKASPLQWQPEAGVAVVRSSGKVEYDWKVSSTNENGSVAVFKDTPEGTLSKVITATDLAAMQPKFAEGQPVSVDSSAGQDGWQVWKQEPNGDVRVMKPAPSGEGDSKIFRKVVPAAELMQMQHVVEAQAEVSTSQTEPGRLRRLFGRK